MLSDDYKGNDIAFFDDISNWRPFQIELFNKLFQDPPGSIPIEEQQLKPADPRKIIHLLDTVGNTGKSMFFKYLTVRTNVSIGRLTYGSASQLRSSAVNLGPRKLYIVDLTHSKGDLEKQEDLLAVLEDIKSGLLIRTIYGDDRMLVMEPPHILIANNTLLNYEALSEDRWELYKIHNPKGKGPYTLKSFNPKRL